jgi:autotransporter-associated beta strand protein
MYRTGTKPWKNIRQLNRVAGGSASLASGKIEMNCVASALHRACGWPLGFPTVLLSLLCLAAWSDRAEAVDNNWQAGGVANTNYNATTNWDTGTVPAGAGNSAIFGAAGSATIIVNAPVAPDGWTFNAAAQAYTVTGAQVTFGGAGLIANTGNDISIANALAGTGGVAQNGGGTLTLTGALSYSGLTSVTNGSLILGDAARAVTLPGNATINGGNLAIANGSLGTGTITSTGTGIVVGLTPGLAATAGSSTINNGGTLSFMNSGSGGTAQIANIGVLDFADASTASNAVITTSAGALFQFRNTATAANSNITLSGAGSNGTFGNNSTAGNASIIVGANTLLNFQGSSSAGAATITTSAGAALDGNGTTFTGNASGGTSSHIVNAGGLLDISQANGGVTIGSLAGAGLVGLGSNTLTVGANNQSTDFSGIIQNTGLAGGGAAGLIKTGTGALTLSGTNTYTGATVVNAGTLNVNGSIATSSAVTVNNGILGGNGTVANAVINSGGALAPGNSIGTITVNGNLTFNSGSNYNVEVSPSAADRTNVTGTATLNGTVNASYAAGSYVSKQYTILNATGGRVGTFSGLSNTNNPANLAAALSYDANNVFLNLNLIYAAANDTNQRNVGKALTNYFNAGGAIPIAFAGLSAGGLTQASGEAGTGAQQSGIAASGQFVNVVLDNAFDSCPGETAKDGAQPGYTPQRKVSCEAEQAVAAATPKGRFASLYGSWNVWATAYGGNGSVDGDSATGSNEMTSRVYGAVAGASYRESPNTLIGFALGGAGSSFDVAKGLGGGKADMFNAAVYARHTSGAAYVAAALGYTWQNASTDRTVTIAGTDVLHASFRPQAFTARLEGGWRYATPAIGITPYAGLQSTSLVLPSYGETATSGSNQFALSYSSRTVTATRSDLGVRWDKAITVQSGVFTLKAKTAWAHDWNIDRSATATFQTLPGASFTVNGAQPSANAALVSLGADLKWLSGWSLAGSFGGEFSRTSRNYTGKGTLGYAW